MGEATHFKAARRGEPGVSADAEAALLSRGVGVLNPDRCPAGPLDAPKLSTPMPPPAPSTPSPKDAHMSLEPNVPRPSSDVIHRHHRLLSCVLVTLAAGAMAATGLTATAQADTCPNATLREEDNSTQLPECRAYELVTNPFKEGFAPFSEGYAADGTLAYSSVGNFAENGLGAIGNQYVATRSATGWTTAAPAPSGPTYAATGSGAEGFSSDLRSSVWLMRRAEEPSDLAYLYRRGPEGTFTRIGPSNDPALLPLDPPGTLNTGETMFYDGGSADLSHVLFQIHGQSSYPGLVAPGAGFNLYEYVGSENARPRFVGVDNAGNQIYPGCNTGASTISTDGRVIVWGADCAQQLWARINGTTSIDVSASQCTRTSADPGGACNAASNASFQGAATDGSRVFFSTTQQLVNGDTDNSNDLYACDIPPGALAPAGTSNPCASLTEVSGASSNANVQGILRVSADGSRVYFVAHGVLAANLNGRDEPAAAGDENLYVWQRNAAHPAGQTTFVARLEASDADLWGPEEGSSYRMAQSTDEGRYLVLATNSPLLASDTDEARDVYRYDAATGALLRLSTDTSGSGGNEAGFEASLSSPPSKPSPTFSAMSSDGSHVVFITSEALSPRDTNGTADVYEWHDGQVSLISGGKPSLPSLAGTIVWITPSGTDILFSTTAALTGEDADTNSDVYDARIDGGLPISRAETCSEEACRSPLGQQPEGPVASGTATLNGPGNPAQPPTPTTNAKPKPPTRAQKLTKALKACRSKHNREKRSRCERKARRVYRRSK